VNRAARKTFVTLGKVCSVGLLVATASCRREEKKAPRPPPRTELAPLAVPAPSFPLAVPGHGDAVAVAPSGVTSAAPVLVAVLGIGGHHRSGRDPREAHVSTRTPNPNGGRNGEQAR
jgi:hypothetical protein